MCIIGSRLDRAAHLGLRANAASIPLSVVFRVASAFYDLPTFSSFGFFGPSAAALPLFLSSTDLHRLLPHSASSLSLSSYQQIPASPLLISLLLFLKKSTSKLQPAPLSFCLSPLPLSFVNTIQSSMAAGNKFATMLSRNTSRMTVVLVYVALEWVLIVLLLLNSLFSYLIKKFVAYFGLKPPCPWCSRIDHLLEPCREFEGHPFIESVCEAHAKEISRLGYCLKHGRLVEACRTCEGCSLARGCHQGSVIASVSLVAQTDVRDEGEEAKCSCCGAGLNDGFYSKYFLKKGLFKQSWDVLADGDKVASVIREEEEEELEEEKKRKGADEDGEGDKDDDAGQEVVVEAEEEEKEEERRKWSW